MAPAALFNDDDPSSSKKKVCVMDASGHLGSALVHRLLHRGYYVHAALHNHPGELECFEGLAAAAAAAGGDNKRLRVFQSDPLDYHSIMDAIKGCCGLFYSFETPPHQPNYDEYTAEEEVRAAHNVLEACAQTETMEKVVFTSSATAIVWRDSSSSSSPSPSPSPSHHDIDERNWSDINFCKKFKLWHGLSKTVAEKTAWALAMDRGVNMVSINGGLVMGPHLSITNPYLKGAAEMYEDGVFVTVDLRFLVNAHICVFEDVSSHGRYLCFNRVINCKEDAVKLAHVLSPPTTASPPHSVEERMEYQQKISNKKLNKLMVHFESGFQDE